MVINVVYIIVNILVITLLTLLHNTIINRITESHHHPIYLPPSWNAISSDPSFIDSYAPLSPSTHNLTRVVITL